MTTFSTEQYNKCPENLTNNHSLILGYGRMEEHGLIEGVLF
jgi:hypothetical protein